MSSNYPPGVTGAEWNIAGADYEKDFDLYPCPKCGGHLIEQGYSYQRWVSCFGDGPDPDCEFQRDLEPLPDSYPWPEPEEEEHED